MLFRSDCFQKKVASFGHNPKRARIPSEKDGFFARFLCFLFLKLKFCEFLLYALFVPPFPHSPYFYTAIALQPAVSALNQASPKRRFALRIQICSLKLLKSLGSFKFLMAQLLCVSGVKRGVRVKIFNGLRGGRRPPSFCRRFQRGVPSACIWNRA